MMSEIKLSVILIQWNYVKVLLSGDCSVLSWHLLYCFIANS